MIKGIHEKPTVNITLHSKKKKKNECILTKIGNNARIMTPTEHYIESSTHVIRQQKEIKVIKTVKKDIKLSLYAK